MEYKFCVKYSLYVNNYKHDKRLKLGHTSDKVNRICASAIHVQKYITKFYNSCKPFHYIETSEGVHHKFFQELLVKPSTFVSDNIFKVSTVCKL